MKIVIIFADMVRANHMKLVNPAMKDFNEIDKIIQNFNGGTLFTNCFSEGPDTPRGLASFYTGMPPYQTGCSSRQKWPKFFLRNDVETIFDKLINDGYRLDFFSNPNERETGMFPMGVSRMNSHNDDFDMRHYLESIQILEKHLIFISLPDYHWALDDLGYNTRGERQAERSLSKSFEIIFDSLPMANMDHIFLFSDHGFKLDSERVRQKRQLLLNEDRTQVLMFHKSKNDSTLLFNNKLRSLSDLFHTISDLISGRDSINSLYSKKERDWVMIEDHLSFNTEINQSIEIWSVVKNNLIYIRDLNNGYLYDRFTGRMSLGILEECDQILINNSSFGVQHAELNRINKFRKLLYRQDFFMHGEKRRKESHYISRFFSAVDLVLGR